MLNKLNEFYSCIIPTKEIIMAGIDEAGRGPVVGPMVYGLYVASENEISHYKDSKLLTPVAREHFFKNMRNYSCYKIHPAYISSHMEAGSMNLNEIAKEAVIYLLKDLVSKCPNVKTVYIDGLGNNEEYKKTLKKYFSLNFVIENKADSKYQVVSGASIVAKVVRDASVARYNCGSGYTSDPITKEWLKSKYNKFLGFPDYVRHSWSTVKDMLPSKKSRKLQKEFHGFYSGSN
ncbi:ribonuclease HII [Vittaforma corneae ATCC 50505]|uniref:Ribonuclease n=1 Tax=Vittaforma corneae (strain ATCC 50505) TaxID=993615 RepID=L2GP43_VITCO|nr:ribonuclease HII [Vittaforma corneae ATCC 50505]ELA42285.1 ribonuclease HII [Vittaforma corneae ATCC 50505]